MKNLLVIFFLSVQVSWIYSQQCGPNEVYKECGIDRSCEPNCFGTEQRECDPICVKGCFCKENYIRAGEANRSCIPKTECVPCKENEVHTTCGWPEHYDSNCNFEPELIPPPICIERCLCQEGFIKSSRQEDLCVPKEECLTCGENEHFRKKGNMCERPCDVDPNEAWTCPPVILAKCMCNDGYIPVSFNNRTCVLPENC